LKQIDPQTGFKKASEFKKGIMRKTSGALIILLAILSSCVKERFDPAKFDKTLNLSAGVALPIGHLHLVYADFLNDTTAKLITIADTLPFNWIKSALPASGKIEKLIIRLNTVNGFPAAVFTQIYLLDQNKLLIDSLFTSAFKLEAATDLNGDGIIDPVTQGPIDIELSATQINNLYGAGSFVVYGKATTTSLKNSVLPSYFFDFNLGVIAQFKINAVN